MVQASTDFIIVKAEQCQDGTKILVLGLKDKKKIIFQWKLGPEHRINLSVMEYIGIGCALKYNVDNSVRQNILVSSREAVNFWIEGKPKYEPSWLTCATAVDKMHKFLKDVNIKTYTGVIHTYKESDFMSKPGQFTIIDTVNATIAQLSTIVNVK